MKIIVNGREHETTSTELSYDDVVTFVYGKVIKTVVSITYARAATPREEGILSFGQSVAIKDGTIFNAYVTGNS